jgi:hypothetical protein
MFHLIFGVVDILVSVVIALVVGAISRMAMIRRIQDLGLLHALGYGKNWLVQRLALEMAAVAALGWLAGLGLSWLAFWWLGENLYSSAMELNLVNTTPIWFAIPIPLVAVAIVTLSTKRTLGRLDAVGIIDRGTLAFEAGVQRRPVSRTSRSSVRPLSSWIFYRRHKRRGFALAATIALMILGVVFPIFLLTPMIDVDKLRYGYLRDVTLLSPKGSRTLDPGVTAQVRLHQSVERVVPAIRLGLSIDVPPLNRNFVTIFGVSQADMQFLLGVFGLRLEDGRLPEPRANEIVVSRGVAVNRALRLGDKVGEPAYQFDHDLPTEMVVVGILGPDAEDADSQLGRQLQKGDAWFGFASSEYVGSHELYSARPVDLLLVARDGHRAELDAWLEQVVDSDQAIFRTYTHMLLMHRRDVQMLLLLVAVVEGIIAIVAAFALAILGYIFFVQRAGEFGILSALGHSRRWLVRRTVGETVAVVVLAWLMGGMICLVGLVFMQVGLFAPKGMALNFASPAPWASTIPLPLAVIGVSAGLVVRMLSKLDPVSLIERR